jgi:hypothetical protein
MDENTLPIELVEELLRDAYDRGQKSKSVKK